MDKDFARSIYDFAVLFILQKSPKKNAKIIKKLEPPGLAISLLSYVEQAVNRQPGLRLEDS